MQQNNAFATRGGRGGKVIHFRLGRIIQFEADFVVR